MISSVWQERPAAKELETRKCIAKLLFVEDDECPCNMTKGLLHLIAVLIGRKNGNKLSPHG